MSLHNLFGSLNTQKPPSKIQFDNTIILHNFSSKYFSNAILPNFYRFKYID